MATHAPPLAAEAFPQGVAHKALTALAHTHRGVRAAGAKRLSIVSVGAAAFAVAFRTLLDISWL